MQYKGRKLNPPHIILIRCLLYPLLKLLGLMMAGVLVVGWGWDEGKDFWEGL